MAHKSTIPKILEYLRANGYGKPTEIAEAIGASPKRTNVLLRRLANEDGSGVVQDVRSGVYHVARDANGVPQRLGLVAA